MELPRPPEGVIRTPATLAEVCDHLAGAQAFAFDTEFDSASSYRPRLCLVQVATDERVELIDPMELEDLGPFWDLLADPAIEKICHAGEQDLRLAWHLGNQRPQHVFDCQIAAALVGIGYDVAYSRLVEIVAGVELDKAETRSRWHNRPLSSSQLCYAVADVQYMPAIHRVLQERLEALGRMAWLREACDELCVRATEVDLREAFARIKGASRLGSRQQAVLWELTALREEMAREHDVPVRWTLDDETMVQLARRPEAAARLPSSQGLRRGAIDGYRERIAEAIQRGLALPPDQRPHLPRPMQESPEARQLADIMEAYSHVICLAQSVSPKLVTNREKLGELARLVSQGQDPSSHPLMNGWARECLGSPLLEFVSGKAGVSLHMAQGRMHAEFEPRN